MSWASPSKGRRCSVGAVRRRGAAAQRGRRADAACAKDFVTDAHGHCKYVGYTPGSMPLLESAGVASVLDDGYIVLDNKTSVGTFIEHCRTLRYWGRSGSA